MWAPNPDEAPYRMVQASQRCMKRWGLFEDDKVWWVINRHGITVTWRMTSTEALRCVEKWNAEVATQLMVGD